MGRPGPPRFTFPPAISCGKITASCRGPGVNTRVNNWPFPSARRCTLVLNPPWLRPHASAAGSLVLPQRHAGGPGQRSHRHSGPPNRSCPHDQLGLARPQTCAPRSRPCATERSDWPPCARGHTARASLSKAHPCGGSTQYRSGCGGGPRPAAPSWVFGVGAAVAAAPIACWSNLLGSYPPVYGSEETLQTRPSTLT